MTSMMQARNAYATGNASTASPARLLLMLYDRLVLDIELGSEALGLHDRSLAHAKLIHAQEIIVELRTSLDLSIWPEGSGLASLYTWLLAELVGANVSGDEAKARSTLPMVWSLRDTWREAAIAVSGSDA